MYRRYLLGTLLLLFGSLMGCSPNTLTENSSDTHKFKNEIPFKVNSSRTIGLSEKEYTEDGEAAPIEEKQELSSNKNNIKPSTSKNENVSYEEKELLRKNLRTFIFDEYMSGPDYVYAKGVNWTENFYDNLSAEEIWNVIEEFKQANDGKEGTFFEQASYLSQHAPIKDNWKELFLENWSNSYLSEDHKIETLMDYGDSVGVYTDSLPYTGAKDNFPLITLFKRTGYWHG